MRILSVGGNDKREIGSGERKRKEGEMDLLHL
jgi:hypothetical protein